ncbi:type VI secretion system baseplate subunit TssF [Niveibacterium sp. 24ML]|uniref:type VI secretion system baseplate subunit TssF n=1 Tax=Niveibacterium sp. 24ML TaxID=2985512 RepID=UPI00226E6C7D|nr:type VI secretion system baseplate subunit TssF [Niveibacterium sp. 24ML]MCX9156615.1 type VI secretion system baseplate subunit TssF [Niveibacterium sp. 24ML]
MDPRLLRYYNDELRHLREMGAEFAQQFPKIAGRLGIDGIEVTDPYVERLMEGFAFLASRVQLKIDAEFPRFTQRLLEMLYPHYLAPTPAMLVAQLQPVLGDPNLGAGVRIPRGTALQSTVTKSDVSACEFTTAQDVTLWPLEVAQARYFSFAPDVPLPRLAPGVRVKGGVRLRLRATAGLNFKQIAAERLRFFLAGADEVAYRLHEYVGAACLGAVVTPAGQTDVWHEFIAPEKIALAGFGDEEALLPTATRAFGGYRLLQEYFSFPQRYLFFDIDGLRPAFSRHDGSEIEIILLFSRGDAVLESVVEPANFALHCTPAINLFARRTDRIHIDDANHEFQVIVDRTRPMDFEVYDLTEVTGHGTGPDSEQAFEPFYAEYLASETRPHGFYTLRREPRLYSEKQKRVGARSSYIGSEVFISLVDPQEAPYRPDLRQLSLRALCTNRDLPILMPLGLTRSDFSLDISAPVESIKAIKGPCKPYAAIADGASAWKLVSHLSLNYLSLLDSDKQSGAAALREMFELYASTSDAGMRRQIEGLRSIEARPVVTRLPMPGPLCFGRGIQITLDVDELAFEGGSAFLLGAVLERFFARHVSLNSFTETVLRSISRGQIMHWRPRCGLRPTL